MVSLRQLRGKENLHIVLWLIKDFCWIMMYRPLGMLMIAPTLALALHLTWQYRHLRSELFHNLAVTSWIVANSVWMTGEFFFDDSLRPLASIFFFTGLGFILYFYAGRFISGRKPFEPDEGLQE